ncbi:MAG: hypothetical protein AAB038_05570 [Planctomycetota bacterium]
MKPSITKTRNVFAKIGMFSGISFFLMFIIYLSNEINQYRPPYAILLIVSLVITVVSVVITLVLTLLFDKIKEKIGALLGLALVFVYGTCSIKVIIDVWKWSQTYR